MKTSYVVATPAALLALASVHCSAPAELSAENDPEALSGACALKVTQNTYDGPGYWGTMAIQNPGSAAVSGFEVDFDVPSGAACTSDAVPAGATLSASANHCTFTWKSGSLAAGATLTFNYSTNSASFSAASHVAATPLACSGSGSSPPASGPSDYAPYFPTWVWGSGGYAFKSLTDLHAKSGLREVTLAFVLSNGGCNTTRDIEDNASDVKAFLAAGGHVKASFGGASGTYVESKCSSAGALASAIESFVSATGITDLDFDIEQGPALTDAMNATRAQALKTAQAAKGISVAFTLSATPSGLDARGLSVVSHALDAGVKVSHVNLMTMDYGDEYGGKALAPVAIASLAGANAQLVGLGHGLTKATAWRMLGVIPMIGRNDDKEVFSIADAKSLATFARANALGLVSFWSIDRDRVCSGGADECSTVNTSNYQFNAILGATAQ
ncbi:MAG TPA: glycosyl hydrolase family 18 protein [Polyangiaceae bacterium]|jgi:chitinase